MGSFGGTLTLASAASARATVEYALGIIGNGTALFLYFYALHTFTSIWRNGAVGQTKVYPCMVGVLNCLVWALFGLPSVQPGHELMLAVNVFGLTCNVICTVIFLCFAGEQRCFLVCYSLVVEGIVAGGLAALLLTLPRTVENQISWLGFCGDITGASLYVVPVVFDMCRVRKFLNVHHISIVWVTAALLNAVIWTIYACTSEFKRFTFAPNIAGVVALVYELSVYLRYNAAAA